MKIETIPFDIVLSKKIKIKDQSISSKKGHYILLKDHEEIVAVSELSPLLGYSLESLEKAHLQLTQVSKAFLLELPYLSANSEAFLHFLKKHDLCPSVTFALHSLLIDMKSSSKETKTRYQGLLYGEFDEILKKASDYKYSDFFHIKVKLDNYLSKSAILLVRNLINILGKEKKIRIDFCKRWTLNQTEEFLDAFENDAFDYIEDPAQNFKELNYLSTKYDFPIALDELLREVSIDQALALKNLKALIIKPTLDFTYLSLSSIPKNVEIVLSSSYETAVGISCISKLANVLNLKGSHGLDTLSIYPNKIHEDTVDLNPPYISFTDNTISERLNHALELNKTK